MMTMSGKYKDLYGPMINDETFDLTMSERMGALVALQWLDQNLDQVPGRTITESELRAVAGRLFARWPDLGVFMGHLQRELSDLGITHVPDPKPTNAEKLEARLLDLLGVVEAMGNTGVHNMAYELDRAGVKAPGDDDD